MIQFKNNQNKNSSKLHLDKYYTPVVLAKYCIDKTYEIIGKENISDIIEPSAGNGSFSSQIDGCIAYDIEPEEKNITKQDYLELEMGYKKGRLIIGNPPYGSRNILSVKFFKKSIQIADYIGFILPISQLNNSNQMYEFDLIHSEDLGKHIYTDREVHCCFNIYKRPVTGLNKKKTYKFNDLTLVQDRGMKGYKDDLYDFRLCIWGANTGNILNQDEKYAKETAFYINNKDLKTRIEALFSKELIHKEFNFTSTPYLPNSMIYEYILKQIPELQ